MTCSSRWRRGRIVFSLLAVVGASGCSMSEDWMWSHPGDWFGDSRQTRSIKPLPTTPRQPASAQPDRPATPNGVPNLASVPSRPEPSSSASERRRVEAALAADRDNARYTDEQLRGRTSSSVAATPPPANRIPAPPVASSEVPVAVPRTPVARTEVAPPAPAAPVQTAAAPPSSAASRPVPSIVQQPVAPPAPVPLTAAPVPSAPTPSVSAPQSLAEVFQQQLNASSRQTLVGGPQYAAVQPVAPAPVVAAPPRAPAFAPAAAGGSTMALAGGGPFGQPTMVPLYQPTPAAAAAGATSMAQPARLAMTVLPGSRVATIRFADGSARISGDERASLEQAAQLAQSRNARLKVVGYASAGGRQAGLERLKLANFNMSMDRAEAVARELVRLGVNPALIVVEAKPDAAAGADGTKAEIYLEN